MIIALGVLFVTSLILAAVFVAADGDIGLTRTDTAQKKAYYAALAGISTYKYHLASEPNYWKKCPTIANAKEEPVKVPGTEDEKYKVVTLHSEGHTEAECKTGKQSAILQTTGSAIGTFRIESVGTAVEGTNTTTRTLVATFTHPGFINYVYLTNYEILDPAAQSPEPTECEHYYAYRKEHNLLTTCGTIEFAPTDKVNGPMHTNDAAAICAEGTSEPVFGRNKEDKIEMNGGHYGAGGSCSNSPEILGEFTEKGPTLTPPESDSELIEAAETGYRLKGKVYLELKAGTPSNTIAVKNSKGELVENKNYPPNGLVYVENNGSCPIKYSPYNTNYTEDTNCGNAYVKGEYTESLTIAAANDLVVNGSLTTSHETSGKPSGSATLGLIATNFVRIYHPVQKTYTGNLSQASFTGSTKVPLETASTTRETPSFQTTTRAEPSFATAPTKSHGNCTPTSEWESFGGTCYSKVGCSTGYSYAGEGKCAKCNTGYEYLSSEKKCASTNCSSEYTYAGEGKCAKCNTGYEYLSSEKKCASTNCGANETYLTGEGKCAKCPAGDQYIASEKKCASTNCSSGYTYAGNWECAKCNSSEAFETTKRECVKCNTNDTYLKEATCEYQNTSSGCDAENTEPLEPTIDAAILSTKHSFIVDNFKCGKHLGFLNVWGSIAQFWRGPVGTGGGSGTGYTKNYNYDDRLETLQPPDFLSPTSSSLKLSRITEVKNGYTG
ncbi:MAG TPA: hypothetical protein VGI24_02280 [Solirubrobacteraceae bacterium]|jgi:hypothetical protein